MPGVRWARTERELRRSHEDLERFALMAGHDLQEPLRMVRAYTQLLARQYQGQFDSRADQFLRQILRGSEHVDRENLD